MNVGFLHPGLMGETLAANCGAQTYWVTEGRSADTQARADSHGMQAVDTIAELGATADVIISICPPAAALDVAHAVSASDFAGLYVDANAISPDSARTIGKLFEHVVDGSVIGPPAHKPGTTRLYLSGDRASEVSDLFADGMVDARVIGDSVGEASALKMAYASWTKIGSAMHMAIRAFASAEGVDAALVDEWNLSQPGMVKRSDVIASRVSPKAWRFTGEMEQIAAAFESAGLPAGFATSAYEIYEQMAGFKGTEDTTLDAVIEALRTDR